MRASIFRSFLAVVPILLASVSNAGQRRVEVGVGFQSISFGPQDQTLNLGDQVTWIWVGSGHNVVNGSGPGGPGTGTIFNTTTLGSTGAFTWKASQSGFVPYFCSPHFSLGMTGSLLISTAVVSSFRITEVQYNDATGHDRIEIANLGGDFGDLGRYRISINGTTAATVPLRDVGVQSGSSPGRVVIRTNEGTTGSTTTDLRMGGIGDLPLTGSVALFAPNTINTSLPDATQIVDFVQWGAGNQPNAATAVAAGIWPSTSEFVPAVPVAGNYDLVFCGVESDHGAAHWDVGHPNFGTQSLCATPTQASTWGRIKLLYR